MMETNLKKVGAFKLLPPKPYVCQVCATKHPPAQPHNQQSLYYQYYFYADHHRFPRWEDAMAHCSDEIKQRWIAALKEKGINV